MFSYGLHDNFTLDLCAEVFISRYKTFRDSALHLNASFSRIVYYFGSSTIHIQQV